MIETTAQSAILTHLRYHLPTLLGVYAFGSQVQGTATVGSDLDLAVLVEGYADPVQLWELAQASKSPRQRRVLCVYCIF